MDERPWKDNFIEEDNSKNIWLISVSLLFFFSYQVMIRKKKAKKAKGDIYL